MGAKREKAKPPDLPRNDYFSLADDYLKLTVEFAPTVDALSRFFEHKEVVDHATMLIGEVTNWASKTKWKTTSDIKAMEELVLKVKELKCPSVVGGLLRNRDIDTPKLFEATLNFIHLCTADMVDDAKGLEINEGKSLEDIAGELLGYPEVGAMLSAAKSWINRNHAEDPDMYKNLSDAALT